MLVSRFDMFESSLLLFLGSDFLFCIFAIQVIKATTVYVYSQLWIWLFSYTYLAWHDRFHISLAFIEYNNLKLSKTKFHVTFEFKLKQLIKTGPG